MHQNSEPYTWVSWTTQVFTGGGFVTQDTPKLQHTAWISQIPALFLSLSPQMSITCRLLIYSHSCHPSCELQVRMPAWSPGCHHRVQDTWCERCRCRASGWHRHPLTSTVCTKSKLSTRAKTVGQRWAAATEFISGSKSLPQLRNIWAWSSHSACWRQTVSQRHCGTCWLLEPDPNAYMSTWHSQHLPLPLPLSWHVLVSSLQFVLCLEKLCKHFSALPGIYFFIPVCPVGGPGNEMLF